MPRNRLGYRLVPQNQAHLRPISHTPEQASSIGPHPVSQLTLDTTADTPKQYQQTHNMINGATLYPQSGLHKQYQNNSAAQANCSLWIKTLQQFIK